MKKLFLILLILLCFSDANARDVVSSRSTVASRTTTSSRLNMDEVWDIGIGLNPSITSSNIHNVHDMLLWGGNLIIAKGQGTDTQGRTQIYKRSTSTGVRTQLWNTAGTGYVSSKTIWRSLGAFSVTGNLYAGLGDENYTYAYGKIWEYNGTTASEVFSSGYGDCYAIMEYSSKLYAGCGTNTGGITELYSSSNGTTWVSVRTFAADYVRSLAVWKGKLYIGLRTSSGIGDLWSYDGTTFTDLGTLVGLTSQVKTIVPAGDYIYIAGNPPYIGRSSDGVNFTQVFDATIEEGNGAEIYKGIYASNGNAYFPLRQNPANAGRVIRCNGASCEFIYTESRSKNFHVIAEAGGYLWAGGENQANTPTSLYRTLLDRTTVP